MVEKARRLRVLVEQQARRLIGMASVCGERHATLSFKLQRIHSSRCIKLSNRAKA